MKTRNILKILLLIVLLSGPGLSVLVYPAGYNPGEGWELSWNDEFDGTALDTNKWNYDVGKSWGNKELEEDTARPENIILSNGYLSITARKESYGNLGAEFTSARITTLGKLAVTYGKIAARIKLPSGKGMWPAFWMLGDNKANAGWPDCGEIDIMEMRGGDEVGDGIIYGTLHWRKDNSHATTAQSSYIKGADGMPVPLNKDFHVFEVEWDSEAISFLMDGKKYNRVWLSTEDMDCFKKPFYIIVNLAVGGQFTGILNSEDIKAAFPQTMLVDWVRVYKKK